MEYQSSPILTTIDTTTYPITKFKFPSITLCNFNHIMKNRYPPEQEDVIGEWVVFWKIHLGCEGFRKSV